MTKFAKHVTILVREDDFTCAESVADKARNHEKITVITNTEVLEVSGKSGIEYIRCKNNKTGEITEYKAEDGSSFGVFVFAGYLPATDILKGICALDKNGYVITDKSQKTTKDGIYAAGDICIKPLRQIVTAVSDGALAACELERYASSMQQKTGLIPTHTVTKGTEKDDDTSENIFTSSMRESLKNVFDKMESNLTLKLYLDEREVSKTLKEYISELCSLNDKLEYTIEYTNAESSFAPCVKICRQNEENCTLSFHGVPTGHEFTSFVLGLYNASGPGQSIDKELEKEIKKINTKKNIKVLVSLSCTLCPELVSAVYRIATLNPLISAEIYDINHFEELKQKYNCMSVPCMVIDDREVLFGKKNLRELIEIIK